MGKYFYHITAPENIESILLYGLRANEEGDIFLFENKSIGSVGVGLNGEGKLCFGTIRTLIADRIALNQIGLTKYAMFEVSSDGIEGDLINDNVAELSSPFQWIAKQETIAPEFLDLFGVYEAERFGEIQEAIRELTEEELRNFSDKI